jgi:nucleoid-associated protein YgaU
MEWRKSWAKNWDAVKYCSYKCRGGKPTGQDRELEQAILLLLAERGAGKTICPSEAARAVAPTEDRTDWEPLMEPARAAARRLVAAGKLVIVQGGRVVDGSTAKGPIRLRLR